MDQDVINDLSRQFREKIHYTGDIEEFTMLFTEIIHIVEDQCALVIEKQPNSVFLLGKPESLKGLLAAQIRGTI